MNYTIRKSIAGRGSSWFCAGFLSIGLLIGSWAIPSQVTATESSPAAELISGAKNYLKEGNYDQAAQNLKQVIEQASGQTEDLQRAYLLLVQTYIMRGNYYKSEPQGRETSELFYREARRYVEDCFRVPTLRHLKPEPATDYPPEMVELFQRVRSELLGSLRILSRNPMDVVVVLDTDTLKSSPTDSLLEETDLPIGPHKISLSRRGYRDYTETIEISAGSVTEKAYALKHRHGTLWYGSRSAVLAGGAVAFILTRPEPKRAQPLPIPPGLPTSQ